MARAQKLTGRGVPGLEHCPSLFHFDMPAGRLSGLIKNPEAGLKQQGITARGPVSVSVAEGPRARKKKREFCTFVVVEDNRVKVYIHPH